MGSPLLTSLCDTAAVQNLATDGPLTSGVADKVSNQQGSLRSFLNVWPWKAPIGLSLWVPTVSFSVFLSP